jgi:pyruvate kinase
MVTLPPDAADDYPLVRDLVAYGMNFARINCAHEDPDAWERMTANIHRANRALCEDCQVFMDLAGPKIRTGSLQLGPRVVAWIPQLDARGRVTAPARIWLAPPKTRPPEGTTADAVVPVPADWIASARTGDLVELADTRNETQELRIVGRTEEGCWAAGWRSAHVETGAELRLLRTGGEDTEPIATARVGKLATVEVPIILEEGDTLILHRDPRPGAPTVRGTDGEVTALAHVGCTVPEVFTDTKAGESIALDDGKMAGVIRSVSPDEMRIEITVAKPGGAKLRAYKGINFPDSQLRVSAITQKDLTDLDFVVQHAHTVGMSFVNDPADVETLQRELHARGGTHLGIVLKIETKRGFAQLPWLLLTAMRSYPVGVMIARGDLAVECGWERLAECQEEILWLCEAAHVPVIWATQVLETLAKKGLPSRAEITDAAMAERAECVMLNKGPYITRAVTSLDHILRRMQEHLDKKTPRLRRLTLAQDL